MLAAVVFALTGTYVLLLRFVLDRTDDKRRKHDLRNLLRFVFAVLAIVGVMAALTQQYVGLAFNEAAELYEDYNFGTVEKWEVLSGELGDPERVALALDEPVRIAAGACPERSGASEWSDDAEDRTEG